MRGFAILSACLLGALLLAGGDLAFSQDTSVKPADPTACKDGAPRYFGRCAGDNNFQCPSPQPIPGTTRWTVYLCDVPDSQWRRRQAANGVELEQEVEYAQRQCMQKGFNRGIWTQWSETRKLADPNQQAGGMAGGELVRCDAQGEAASAYKLCRDPSHGVETAGRDTPWTADSGWIGGGSSPSRYCGSQSAARQQQFPGAEIKLLDSGEESRDASPPFRVIQYRYTCKFVDHVAPVYKEARSPACGAAP